MAVISSSDVIQKSLAVLADDALLVVASDVVPNGAILKHYFQLNFCI